MPSRCIDSLDWCEAIVVISHAFVQDVNKISLSELVELKKSLISGFEGPFIPSAQIWRSDRNRVGLMIFFRLRGDANSLVNLVSPLCIAIDGFPDSTKFEPVFRYHYSRRKRTCWRMVTMFCQSHPMDDNYRKDCSIPRHGLTRLSAISHVLLSKDLLTLKDFTN